MSANQQIKSLSEKGLKTQDLLDDRVDPLDGWHWVNGNELTNNEWGVTAFTRNAVGDYSIDITGAGTYRAILSLSLFARLMSAKGMRITDVVFHYTISGGAATTVDLLIQKALYANAATPTVTNIPFSYDTAHDTNAERITAASHLLIATITSPEFQEADLTWYSAELSVVLPGAQTITVRGAGIHFAHDYL